MKTRLLGRPASILGPVEPVYGTSIIRSAYDPEFDEFVLVDRDRLLASLTYLFREDPHLARRYALAAGACWSSQTQLALVDN
ncbi:MAG: hypothetical protein KKB13_16570 [Chloroflexi bacterium]|nr:hypothetical protein [Chloroflexota bacterium]